MTKEENNVFRDARFGDRFLTRNGRVMIYQKQAREDVYCLFDEESDFVIEYRPNGDVIYEYTGEPEPQEDDIVRKYVQPSLPSDLGEAAVDFANRHATDAIDHELIKGYFKAGAVWMSEQGVSMEYEVEDKCLELGYGSLPGLDPIINLPDSFKPGDKVIVQVRKK